MSGARASPTLLALSCLYILLLSTVPHPSPSETILLCTCRRRPLNCGYVPRARRYTGIIISSFRSYSIIPPRTLRSSGLCTIPTMSHRCLSICLLPPTLCPHAPSHMSLRHEVSGWSPFHFHDLPPHPPPPPTFLFTTPSLWRVTLRDAQVQYRLALDDCGRSRQIACLQECLTRRCSVRRLWEGIDWRSEGAMWIRKTVLLNYLEPFQPPWYSTPFMSFSANSALAPWHASHARSDDRVCRSLDVRATCTISDDSEAVWVAQCRPRPLAAPDTDSNSTTDLYASICPICPGSLPLP